MAIGIATILVLGAAGVYVLKPPTPVPALVPIQSSPRIEAPTIAFSANPPSIKAGESTELRWSTTNADSVTIPNVIDGANPSGNRRVSPTDTTTYTVIAHGKGGEKTETATVQVEKPNPPASAPVVEYFRTEPQKVQPGEATELLWSVKNADRVVLRIPTERGERRVEPVGRMQVRPESTSAYMLLANGTGGEKTAETTVRVDRPPPAQLPKPDIVGKQTGEANEMLSGAGYAGNMISVRPGTPQGRPPGTVIAADYTTTPGHVTVTLDPGVMVPQLKGLPIASAEQNLRSIALLVNPPRYASELDKDDGVVIASEPDGGVHVALNSSVTLTVNRKPTAEPTVPQPSTSQPAPPSCGAIAFRPLPSGSADGEQQAGDYKSRSVRLSLNAYVKKGEAVDYFVVSGGKRLATAPADLAEAAQICAAAKKMPKPGTPTSPCTGQSFTVVIANDGAARLALLYGRDGASWRFCNSGSF
jgi:hypothetical protein